MIPLPQLATVFWRHACVFIYLVFFAANASAQITALCDVANSCSANPSITAGLSSNVSVVWRGIANLKGDTTLVSDSAQLSTPSDDLLVRLSLPLRQNLSANAVGAPVRFSVNETLNVPASISLQAATMGAQQIVYTRTFTLDGISIRGSVRINIQRASLNSSGSIPESIKPGATALGVNRIDLHFSSGQKVEVIESNQALNVLATLNFDRAGVLNAQWEVATPSSTGGLAVFLPLQNIRQYLAAGRQAVIRSPTLPTDVKGLYRVRLRVLQPTIETPEVELRYQVNAASTVKVAAAKNMKNVRPKQGAEISATSAFSWAPEADAVAYQLEVYKSTDDKKPISGLLLKADQIRSPLSASVLHTLAPGKPYFWRVIAVNTSGDIVAASPRREFRIRE
jgi:hypothetical protein